MAPDDEMVALTKAFNEARVRLRQLATERPEGWKTEYARLRPVFDDRSRKASSATYEWLKRHDSDAAAEYEALVKQANTRLAEHQARFPVLVLDGSDPVYLASMKEVDEKFDHVRRFVESKMR